MKTVDFLDALKARYEIASDYALAPFLGVSQQTISQYRAKPQYLDDKVAIKVAQLLDLHPGYVLACVHAERAKRPEVREVWEKTANALKGFGLAVLVALSAPSAAQSYSPSASVPVPLETQIQA